MIDWIDTHQALYAAIGFCCLSVVISMGHVIQHLRHYNMPHVQGMKQACLVSAYLNYFYDDHTYIVSYYHVICVVVQRMLSESSSFARCMQSRRCSPWH